MDQPSSDKILELLTRNERNLSELRQSLDTLSCKVDFLVGQSVTRNQPVAEVSSPVALGDEDPSLRMGTSFGPSPFGIFGDLYPLQAFSNPGILQQTLSDPHMPPPETVPTFMEPYNGGWAGPLPAASRVQTNLIPPMDPSSDDRSYGGYPRIFNNDAWGGGFSGGGHGDHESIEQRTGVSAQQAEGSTSLALAKPKITENDCQSESSTPRTSSSKGKSKGKYARAAKYQEKKRVFSLICDALGLPWNGDEVLVLRTTIERLGKTVPVVQEPTDGPRKAQNLKQGQRSAYIRTLWVAFEFGGRLVELDVLNRALNELTNQPVEPQKDYEGCSVFRV